jgi:hypothetical protein
MIMMAFTLFLVRREEDVNALATDASAKNHAIFILLRLSVALSTIQPHTRQLTREQEAEGDGVRVDEEYCVPTLLISKAKKALEGSLNALGSGNAC